MDEKQDRPKTAVEELDFLNDVIPYRCPKCGDNRKFSKLGDLKLHLETDHSYKVGYVKPRTRVKVFSHSATKGGNKGKNETYLKKLSENDLSSDNSWKNGTGSECDSQSEKRSGMVKEKKRGEREISPLLQSYKQDAKALEMKIKMAKESEMKRRLERNILDNKSNYEFRNSLNDKNTEVLQARQKEWQMADALYQSHDVLLSMEQAAEKRCREQQEVIQDIVNEFKFKENQLSQANTDLEKLKFERERLMLETENLLKSADKGQEHLREELSKREEMLSSISDELETVKIVATQELQKRDGELAETKSKLESLASERDLLLKETSELSDKAGQHSSLLKRTLEVKERQLRKVNKEMEKLKTEQNSLVEESINLYKTANDGNNKLKELVKSKDNQLSQAYQELGQMKELHEKLVWEANLLTKQADENNEKLKALFRSKEEQLLDAQVELERVKVEQNMLLESAKGLQDKVEFADEKVNELQSAVCQKEEQLAQKEKELESIQSFLSSTAEKESVARDKLEKFISGLIDRADNAERELVVLKSRSNSSTSGSPKHLPVQLPVQNTADSDGDISCSSSIVLSDISNSQEFPARSKSKSFLPESKMGIQSSVVPLEQADIVKQDDSSANLPQKINSNFAGMNSSEMGSKTRNIKKEEVEVLLHAGIDLHDAPNMVNTTAYNQKTFYGDSQSKTGSINSQTSSQNLPNGSLHRHAPNSAPKKPPRHQDSSPIHNQQKSQTRNHRENAEAIPTYQNLQSYHRQNPEGQQWKNTESTAIYPQQNSESHGQLRNPKTKPPPIHEQQIQDKIPKQPQYQNTERVLTIQPPPEFLDSDDVYAVVRSDSDDFHVNNSMPHNQDFQQEQGFQKSENVLSYNKNNDGNLSSVYLEELGNAKINVLGFMKSEEIPRYKTLEEGSENNAKIMRHSVNDPQYFADKVMSKPGNTHHCQKIKTNNLHNHSAHRRKPYELHMYDGYRVENGLTEPCPREITADSQREAIKLSKVPEQFYNQNESNLAQAHQTNGNTDEYQTSVVSDSLSDHVEHLDIPNRHHSERLGSIRNGPQNVKWQNDINLLNADRQKYNTVHNSHGSELNSELPPFPPSNPAYFGSDNQVTNNDLNGPVNFKMHHSAENERQKMYMPYHVKTGIPVLPTMSFQNTPNFEGHPGKPVSSIQSVPYSNTKTMDMWSGKPVLDIQQPLSYQNTTKVERKPGNSISNIQPLPITTETDGRLLSIFSHEPVYSMPEDEYQSRLVHQGTNSQSLSDLPDDEDDQDHSLNDIVSIPEYENYFSEPEDNENSISEFHETMDDNGILWDMKYQNTDYGVYWKNQNTPTWKNPINNSSEKDKRGLHVRFKNDYQVDDTKLNLKSKSAESFESFSCDSYMPVQRRNGVMSNLSDRDDFDELTDFNTRYNSKSPSLESLKSASSDSYLSIQKRDAKIQTPSDHEQFYFQESNCNLKSPSTGSLGTVSSDSYIPIQRRDAKTQTVVPELKVMADNETKKNLKSPSSESLGSFSSDSYIPLAKNGMGFEHESGVYKKGVPLTERISQKHDNLHKTKNSSTQTWLLDRHITSANIELIRERSPLVENRTLLDDNYGNSNLLSNVPRNKIQDLTRSNDNQRLGEFIIDKEMLRSEIDRRIEEKLQSRNKILHENDSKSPLVNSQANEIYANRNVDFDEADRKISNVEREQYLGKHSTGSKVNTDKDQILRREDCSSRELADDRLKPKTESIIEKSKTLNYDGASVTKIENEMPQDDQIITKETVSKTESVQEMPYSEVHRGGPSSESYSEVHKGGPSSQSYSEVHRGGPSSQSYSEVHKGGPSSQSYSEVHKGGPSSQSYSEVHKGGPSSQSYSEVHKGGPSSQSYSEVHRGGPSSESVTDNSLKVNNTSEVCLDKENKSRGESNEKDGDSTSKTFKQEVIVDPAMREFESKMSEENKPEDLQSLVSMETLNDSGINISSSNEFGTDGVHEEHIRRHMSPRMALKNTGRSFSMDDDGSFTQSERSYPSDGSKLEMEIGSCGNEDSQNEEVKTNSAENRHRKTGMVQDEQLDHMYDGNSVKSSWLTEQKQSQYEMLSDLTDTDDDYCQSLTSLEDFRERLSVTSSLDSRLDTSVYKKREEIRNRRNALFQIFSFLDTKSLVDVALVCREWRKVSRQSGLWKKVSLTYRKISTKFLMTVSSWCTQTEHLILEGLQPRDMYEGESREGYTGKISGSLEPGLERLLQQSESTLKCIRIVNCGRLLTDKSIWLVSCYSRVIKNICYISDTFPLGADVMWAVGSGCRDINTLIIPPKYPCSSPEKFDNKCLQIISQCCHDLVRLSIGGSLIDINGLVLVAKSCQRLLELEFHYGNDMTEDVATAICRLGLNPLQCLRFIHTPVDDKAVLQFYKSCKHLKLIQIDLSASDYVDDLVNEDNVKIFKKYADKLTKLCKKPGLGNILKLHLNDAS